MRIFVGNLAYTTKYCTAPTVKARIVCDMARHGKASNGLGAVRAPITGAHFS